MIPISGSSRPEDRRPDVAVEIEQAALRLLARREHSRKELRGKLAAKGHAADFVDPVLDDLERRGLLSERRFAESYIASRRRKGYGPLRIRAELRERGIEPAEFEAELSPDAGQWWDLMVDTTERRFGTAPAGDDRREQGRRARFLQQRGFSPEMIRRFLWDSGDF